MTAALFALSLAAGGLMVVGVAAAPDVPHRQEVEKWRAKHEADYRREYVGPGRAVRAQAGREYRRQRRVERHRAAEVDAGRRRDGSCWTASTSDSSRSAGVTVTLKGSRSPRRSN